MFSLDTEGQDDEEEEEEEDDDEEEEEDEEDEEDDDEDETGSKTASTARPRRMSELNIPNKVKPIPEGTALFVFTKTNKYVRSPFIENITAKYL